MAGCDVKLDLLHSHISFPVLTGTPMIAPLWKWDHSQDWSAFIGNSLNNLSHFNEEKVTRFVLIIKTHSNSLATM